MYGGLVLKNGSNKGNAIDNFRLITPLNVDLKILAKMLTER